MVKWLSNHSAIQPFSHSTISISQMEAKINILTFPQRIENDRLFFNVLLIPRNFNPLLADEVQPGSPAWVDANIVLNAHILPALDKYPRLDLASEVFPLPVMPADPDAREIFSTLAARFDISSTATAETPKPQHFARKYLPQSYRQAFNFTKPRTDRAAIDDSYACAIGKEKSPDPLFVPDDDTVSWGQVFAFCLRQPAIAKKCGFIREASVDLPPGFLEKGGWLYVDIAVGSDYLFADLRIVKRYAARLPKIPAGTNRGLFAAVLFPVRHDEVSLPPDNPELPSVFDELLLEASIYDDGFAKIVHAQQPVSDHLLKEDADPDFPVTNDAGIRLGWDDEQLLIWMNRQLEEDSAKPAGSGLRVDAPMGVLSYRIDVREQSPDPDFPNPWVSLCQVSNKNDLAVGAATVDVAGQTHELGVEVYPAIPDGRKSKHFWLPAFFAYWTGKSLVLPDEDAIDLYRKEQNELEGGTQKLTKNAVYSPVGLENVPLLYGKNYQFRTRLSDISGGGPALAETPVYDAPAPVARHLFRRHAIPQTLRTEQIFPQDDTLYFVDDSLTLKRPLLGYPSVLFTGAYPNALDLLKIDFDAALGKRDIGIADPDVDRVEIEVAVRALDMDTTIPKYQPSDHFAILYTTTRQFPADFDGELVLPFSFADRPVISFNGSKDLSLLGLSDNADIIDEIAPIVLPTNRDIQITIRAICSEKPGYYAGESALKGMRTRFVTRRDAAIERDFFKATNVQTQIRGIYLRRPEEKKVKAKLKYIFVGKKAEPDAQPDLMARLAAAIDVEAKGMSLMGKTGQRWQFGAARAIRHTLSPDNTSLTIATEDDLVNHWLVPITLLVNRDWTWDGIQPVSIDIFRRKKFALAADWDAEELVGDIEFKKGINIQALVKSDRSQSFICFVDAVEPKSSDPSHFPDEILLEYHIQPNFKTQIVPVEADPPLTLNLHLPITTPPAEMPKIVSAGMAMSRYVRDADYANTQVRQKYLWVEFDQAVQNPRDAYFARITAYAPDPLLAEWQQHWMTPRLEPPLTLDPEWIRIISPGHSDNQAGLNAMQQLVPATTGNRHFLVPLPPGLHAESPELFGFFTYEIRVGHLQGWATAQSRFGRGLTYQGVQHPAPQLLCRPERSDKGLSVSSLHAESVFDGSRVTANPVRTRIWALLYAQVRMADDSDNRNILLDDRLMRLRPRIVSRENGELVFDGEQADTAKRSVAEWSNAEIKSRLEHYGLPTDSRLSVLCVEMMPMHEEFLLHNQVWEQNLYYAHNIGEPSEAFRFLQHTEQGMQLSAALSKEVPQELMPRPLSEDIGYYRMLRSSALVGAPEICCVDC